MNTDLRLSITASVLAEIEQFLTDRGSHGLEGAGLLACRPSHDPALPWRADRVVIPEQIGQRNLVGVSVEVTDRGKSQLAAALALEERYLARVHSHPGEAFHSDTDDANPALTHNGALSIVVPYFGLGLRRGLSACAVYRLDGGGWEELAVGAHRDRWLVTT